MLEIYLKGFFFVTAAHVVSNLNLGITNFMFASKHGNE